MHKIMLMNAKGGCGKSTLATNLASWYADEGLKVALADFDPQRSSLDWLEARQDYTGIPEIEAIDATKAAPKPARGTNLLVMDAPAGVHGKQINQMLRRVDSLIIPVLPSPIDIRACRRHLDELLRSGRVLRHQTRIGFVANRVNRKTRAYKDLKRFLGDLNFPVIGHLRESQSYIRAAETGLGVFELPRSSVYKDLPPWNSLLDWVDEGLNS
jgi:chromosome partitioning protein